MHVVQLLTYCVMYSCMLVQKYPQLTNSYVPPIPKCPVIGVSWYNSKRRRLKSFLSGTQILPFSPTGSVSVTSDLISSQIVASESIAHKYAHSRASIISSLFKPKSIAEISSCLIGNILFSGNGLNSSFSSLSG